MTMPRPITISINALGGQGGGVLSGWIVELAEAQGYIAQSTSVPGVAQRTGATVYCVEIFPKSVAEEEGKAPILSLMPVPGDVDIVLASEWMEAGRAIARGFVTPNLTTLIASTHRDYAISEKSAMGDGIADADKVREAANTHSKQLIAFDMQAAAREAGSVISAVLFGALGGSGALPFPRDAYETIIKQGGRAVDANLRAFASGWERAQSEIQEEVPSPKRIAANGVKGAEALLVNLQRTFPHQIHDVVIEGARRLADYQDRRYVDYYTDLLKPIVKTDDAALGYRLTREVARHLALWMSYEDVIRVADLKTRGSRFERVRNEVRAEKGQIVETSEYLHPRVEELRDTLPLTLGRMVENNPHLQRLLSRFMHKGRRISTTSLSGFILLRFVAALRPMRRRSYRFNQEMQAIEAWLTRIRAVAEVNYELAIEIARAQRLIKGYGDTHARGSRNYAKIMAHLDELGDGVDAAQRLQDLTKAALADDEGRTLAKALGDA